LRAGTRPRLQRSSCRRRRRHKPHDSLSQTPGSPPGAGFARPFVHSRQEIAMNWDQVQGNWKQMTGKVREQWGKLTDDDLTQINGRREQLEGKIQERYGYSKDQAKKAVDDYFNRI
jgi:uncharacterized protein YjbJ (UPF0337 family)